MQFIDSELATASTVRSFHFLIFILITLIVGQDNAHCAEQRRLNEHSQFFEVTSSAYQELIKNRKIDYPISDDLKLIIKRSEEAKAADNPVLAMCTIIGNISSINQQIHRPEIQMVAAIILSLDGKLETETLLQVAKQQGDNLAEARIAFELAKYNSSHADWPAVQTLLNTPSLIDSLSKDNADEAQILRGVAFQELKKHREAMPYYTKIALKSPHYRLAQLNLATANIRQDWWTDAQLAIKSALDVNKANRDELDYHLYTLLGYSQIQFGFYRDARESFRNVALGSRYTNRALLGLGVAALHQEDFIGALNAFNLLRGKQESDISIAESFLLSAFTLRQLKQFDGAQKNYEEAITYYSRLSEKLGQDMITIKGSAPNDAVTERALLRPDSRKNKRLQQLSKKLKIVHHLQGQLLSEPKANNLTGLKKQLEHSYTETALELVNADQASIESYLSQSRFGLATLYDGR